MAAGHVTRFVALTPEEIVELWPALEGVKPSELPQAFRVECECAWRSKATVGQSGLATIALVHRLAAHDEVLP
jgi:hypothetical protein